MYDMFHGSHELLLFCFPRDMFNLPNKAGAEAVLYFLFNRLNPVMCRQEFRSVTGSRCEMIVLDARSKCNQAECQYLYYTA